MRRRISILLPATLFFFILGALLVWILLSGSENLKLAGILALVAIVVLLLGAVLFFIRMFLPLHRLSGKLSSLNKGEIPGMDMGGNYNEYSDISESLRLHFHYLEDVILFASDISSGELTSNLEIRGEEDRIGKAMLQIKERLITTKQEAENRRTLDEQQNWAAHGLATIGELLRNTEDDITVMSNAFIRELVKYVDMEVGGFFIVRDDDGDEPELELTGSYAFDREKQVEKRFKFGEGLVGRCAVEKDSIVITELPADYIRIRSGLGEDYPATLILVPVLLDKQVLGVIELASFASIPEYKIKFIKSLSNSIAASVTKVKVNISTARLLQQSRQQSEDLYAREQEMKQSMEQLKSTQELSALREAKLLEEVELLKKELGRR